MRGTVRIKLISIFCVITLLWVSHFQVAPVISAENTGFDSKISSALSLRINLKTNLNASGKSNSHQPTHPTDADIQTSGDLSELQKEQVFLYFSQKPTAAQLSELSASGITVYPDSWVPPVGRHQSGFLLADVPVDKVEAIAAKNYIVRMDTAEETARPQNDLARAAMKVDDLWNGNDTGAGVTVAVLDSGIDISNPDFPFLTAENSKDYSNYPALDNTITNSVTGTGHGTHVAGSLLGRGTNSAKYKGVAPGAGLVFLKIADRYGVATTRAMTYAIRDAVDIYHARIINISYGSWKTYHDGTDAGCQAVDYAVSQGATVFTSAGNEADNRWHYSGTANAGITTEDIPVTVASGTSYLWMNLVWYDGPDIHNSLSLQYYDSNHTQIFPKPSKQSESPRGTESIQYEFMDNPVATGIYYLRVKNSSSNSQFFHIYFMGEDEDVEFSQPDPYYTLNGPGEADGAIAVGAYVTRTTWQDYQGNTWKKTTPLGTIAGFSSRGPRVDGPAPGKPNFVAPGVGIISVRDKTAYPWPDYNTQTEDYPYAKYIIDNDNLNLDGSGPADYYLMQGTSMSSPLAAGVGALLMSQNSTLNPAQIRHTLEKTASKGSSGRDDIDGWGLIDALAASKARTPWDSYSDSTHTTSCTIFSDYNTQHTVYWSGTSYLINHTYKIDYYDGSNKKVATDTFKSNSSGSLASQHTFLAETDTPGTWHTIIYEPEFSLPDVYSANIPYAIVTGTFSVQDSAITAQPVLVPEPALQSP